MVQQIEITLQPKRRGFHLVTSEIVSQLPKLPKTGIVNIFTKHTSCGLSINENCDPDVRIDMETIFNRLVPENRPEYEHTLEGADDMPAHAKSTLSGVSITIPITDGRLNLGTLGMVNQHKHLLKPGDQCIGGGYYHFDFVSNRILLDRESYDFGRPKWHLLETLKVPSTYRGMRIVYSYDDGFHDDFCVSEELQIEYYD